MKPTPTICCLALLATLATLAVPPARAANPKRAWTDPETARRENPDFSIQGEYGSPDPGAPAGVQVVALGDGKFDAFLLKGGLPGLGWTRDLPRTPLSGSRDGDHVTLTSPDRTVSATIRDARITITRTDADPLTLPRIERTSPTLGANPPPGAVVLFDGSSTDHWNKGRIQDGLLAPSNSLSKQTFTDYTLHLEFRTPYQPWARGQGRGNSGVYFAGRWETQILDSFGLEGKQNECGGLYSVADPLLNMCLPPLAWQTYDVDFTAPRFDARGNRTAWPTITVKLNGVTIHQNREIPTDFTRAAPIRGPVKQPDGPIFLQHHGNPVLFRNIWVAPRPSP